MHFEECVIILLQFFFKSALYSLASTNWRDQDEDQSLRFGRGKLLLRVASSTVALNYFPRL